VILDLILEEPIELKELENYDKAMMTLGGTVLRKIKMEDSGIEESERLSNKFRVLIL
jgi:hypothetical protein